MYSILSEEIVLKIRKEVEKIKEEYQIVNPIVRSDIFEILDNICVVLRYPLDNDAEEEFGQETIDRFITK